MHVQTDAQNRLLNAYQVSSMYCGVWQLMLTIISRRKIDTGSYGRVNDWSS